MDKDEFNLTGPDQDRWVRTGKGPFGQTVVASVPPMYDEVIDRFPAVIGAAVVFSYGDKVYNPQAIRVPYEILAHEAVHADRQEIYGVEKWWDSYLTDDVFRLEEEFDAHLLEHEMLQEWCRNRAERRQYEAIMSKKLASPIYDFRQPRLAMRDALRKGSL